MNKRGEISHYIIITLIIIVKHLISVLLLLPLPHVTYKHPANILVYSLCNLYLSKM